MEDNPRGHCPHTECGHCCDTEQGCGQCCETEYGHEHCLRAECEHCCDAEQGGRERCDAEYGSGLFALTVSPLSEGVSPAATFVYSDTDNTLYITWTDNTCAGKLNGASYTKGTWIKQEGNYEFIITDADGLFTKYTFKIDHYYTTTIIPATCSERGYTRHTCKQCGHTYDTDTTPILGHKYVESTVYATCTDNGGIKHTCTVCGYFYLTDIIYASGHNYDSTVIREPTCTATGQLHEKCEYCGDELNTIVPALGHNYIIVEVTKSGKNTMRKLECTHCGSTYTENLGNQYEKVGAYMELIINTYRPYMIAVFFGTAGVWSIFIGISYIIAQKNEEKEKAKKTLINYIVGLVAIFCILVACPYLIRGITALVT
jgi:transposase-like protein